VVEGQRLEVDPSVDRYKREIANLTVASNQTATKGGAQRGKTASLKLCYIWAMDVSVFQLRRAVESQHGGTAKLAQSVPVKETFGGKTVWEGVVQVFDLTGHPKAKRAYTWSSPIGGSDKRRFFAVLYVPPITSPLDAVRAAIVAEHKTRR